MAEVTTYPDRRKVRRKTGGELYECIMPLTVFIYARSGQTAANAIQSELEQRLAGLQYVVDESLIRLAEIEHVVA